MLRNDWQLELLEEPEDSEVLLVSRWEVGVPKRSGLSTMSTKKYLARLRCELVILSTKFGGRIDNRSIFNNLFAFPHFIWPYLLNQSWDFHMIHSVR